MDRQSPVHPHSKFKKLFGDKNPLFLVYKKLKLYFNVI